MRDAIGRLLGWFLEGRLALIEDDVRKLHVLVTNYDLPSRDSLLFVDSADWCGKRHKFVTNVRVIDKTGTRRETLLLDTLDDVAVRAALAAKAGR